MAAVLLWGCGGGNTRESVVLITVDTLRPDHLGFGGAEHPTSPTLDALAERGVVFTRAYSQAGWTIPSIASILTGRYPGEHGATDFHWSLDASLRTLPGILRREGYDTAALVSHVVLTPSYGFGDGFASYDYSVLDVGNPHDVSTARELTDRALAKIGRLERPYFLWIHYFDPHFAYLPHAPFASFGSRDVDRYDQEIAHTDRQIARLLRAIDREHTVVVFTGDHGEEFGEHGGKYHYTLHDEVLRVPLVIAAPGEAPRKVDTPVEQVDLLPTILACLGIAPPDTLPGRNLLAPGLAARPLYVERERPPAWRQYGVIAGSKKLLVVEPVDIENVPPASRGTEVPVTNVVPGVYLYDLAADPSEKNNLFTETNRNALELLALAAAHFRSRERRREPLELSDDLVRKLRSLGYLK